MSNTLAHASNSDSELCAGIHWFLLLGMYPFALTCDLDEHLSLVARNPDFGNRATEMAVNICEASCTMQKIAVSTSRGRAPEVIGNSESNVDVASLLKSFKKQAKSPRDCKRSTAVAYLPRLYSRKSELRALSGRTQIIKRSKWGDFHGIGS